MVNISVGRTEHRNKNFRCVCSRKYSAKALTRGTKSAQTHALHGGWCAKKGFLDDLYIADASTLKWYFVESVQKPSARMMHAICVRDVGTEAQPGLQVYLYGGMGQSATTLSDFYRFNLPLKTNHDDFFSHNLNDVLHGEWRQLECALGHPPEMVGHSLTVCPCSGDIVLFGGLSALQLSVKQMRANGPMFTEPSCARKEYLWSWADGRGWTALDILDDQQSMRPKRRAGHSAVIAKRKLFIFGGEDMSANLLSDLWEFDLTLKRWRRISSYYDTVKPVAYACNALISSRFWCVLSLTCSRALNSKRVHVCESSLIQICDVDKENWISTALIGHGEPTHAICNESSFFLKIPKCTRSRESTGENVHYFQFDGVSNVDSVIERRNSIQIVGAIDENNLTTFTDVARESEPEVLNNEDLRVEVPTMQAVRKKVEKKRVPGPGPVHAAPKKVRQERKLTPNAKVRGPVKTQTEVSAKAVKILHAGQNIGKDAEKNETRWMQQFTSNIDFDYPGYAAMR